MTAAPPRRLPRSLHPGAWWLWALGLAAAATATTNPILLLLLASVVALVVAARGASREGLPGFRLYLALALLVVLVRIGFRVLLGGGVGTTVLLRLPELQLPDVAAGIRVGGAVTAEGLVAAASDGLRLAVLIVCVGAANVLADPRRLLRAAPGALYELGTTLVLALGIAPQLVSSVARVRRARRLRGDTRRGLRALRPTLVPVMEDALDRSLLLAAAMDSRGYGRRRRDVPGHRRRLAAGALLAGLLALTIGVYGLLDGTAPRLLGAPALAAGAALALLGLHQAGQQVRRSRYRPLPWGAAETVVALLGVAAAVVLLAGIGGDGGALHPSVNPLVWPQLPVLPAAALLLASLPAVLAPPTPPAALAPTAAAGPRAQV
ncbi:MAG: energy-coupling factor transporter transmembrane protein EcfT, partial [Actinobacteria bacterium]|nr:energy-coupling factor transporter transmembrane protein EcfT [Actinomycetota bacterium]